MKKIIFLMLTIPSLVFSQGVGKTNLGLTLGFNIPAASEKFTNDYNASYNFGFFVEHTAGKVIVTGGEFNFSRFAPSSFEVHSVKFGSLQFIMKVQNNLLREGDVQFFVKGGAGLALLHYDNPTPQHGGYLPLTYSLSSGAGANYLLPGGAKIFAETNYRFFPANANAQNGIYFNAGVSFYMR